MTIDRLRLHAYVDGELTPDEVQDFERGLSVDSRAEVAALRAQKDAMHARYDALLDAQAPHSPDRRSRSSIDASRGMIGLALAASLLLTTGLGLGVGWIARGHADLRGSVANGFPVAGASAKEDRLQDFVHAASLSYAVFSPEVRHPVEVAAADEAHLVTWLSKRLDAPLVVPHLDDAGWELLGGRLLPADSGPIALFMYQDARGRRLTLAISRGVSVDGRPMRPASVEAGASTFRIAEENGNTVFYWIDDDYAYALTGKLAHDEMTRVASRVYRQLDR